MYFPPATKFTDPSLRTTDLFKIEACLQPRILDDTFIPIAVFSLLIIWMNIFQREGAMPCVSPFHLRLAVIDAVWRFSWHCNNSSRGWPSLSAFFKVRFRGSTQQHPVQVCSGSKTCVSSEGCPSTYIFISLINNGSLVVHLYPSEAFGVHKITN